MTSGKFLLELETCMDELVKLIVKKTGIPTATAVMVVNIVLDYIKKKLPGSIGAEIDIFLRNDSAIKTAEDLIGSLTSKPKKKK
jgi:hypothetical protein